MRITIDGFLVGYPTSDRDVASGTRYSCAAAGETVIAGGSDSGVNCFDAQGVRRYQANCRLVCQANETVTEEKASQLKGLVTAAVNFMKSQLEVLSTDNSTIQVYSTAEESCGGTSIARYRTVPDADMLIMLTARPTRNLGSNVNAVGVACQLHGGSNRPVLAHLNVNPIAIMDTNSRDNARETVDGKYRAYADLFDDIVHQLFHVFGFSNSSYPLFKYPAGDHSKTYNEYNPSAFPTGPISGAGVSSAPSLHLNSNNVAPGDKIYFKGPTVAAVAKKYFGCGAPGSAIDTNGVELENGGGSSVVGNHWEKRVFFSEFILGAPAPQQRLSVFSWALLQDTGYFNVPLLQRQNLEDRSGMTFGKGMGCAWLTQTCDKWDEDYFCRTSNAPACGFDKSFIAVCDLRQFANDLPVSYRYFPADAKLGGVDGLADNCPQNRLMQYGECTVEINAERLGADRERKQGMNFGAQSRCFINRLVSSSFSQPGGSALSGCYQSFCGGAQNNNNSYIVVGQEAVVCAAENEVVELFPPVRFNKANFSATTAGATIQLSYNYHGMLQCGNLKSYCAAGVSKAKNITAPIITEVLPTVTKVDPAWGDPTGGALVTIIGTRLSRCTSAIIGGVALDNFVVVNETAAKGRLQNVGQSFGGPTLKDGTGDALVELQCFVYEVRRCSGAGGCIVFRGNNLFNYSFTDPKKPLTASAGVFSDFFDSVGGKVVGIVMCVVVIVILIVLARLCFKDGHKVGEKLMEPEQPPDSDDEKDAKREQQDDGNSSNNNYNNAATAGGASVPVTDGNNNYVPVAVANSSDAAASGAGAAAPTAVSTSGGQADLVPEEEEEEDDEINIELELAALNGGGGDEEMTVYI